MDTVDHTILKCEGLREARAELCAGDIPDLVEKMLTSEEEWRRISRRIDAIMKLKEELEKKRWRRLELMANQAPQPPRDQGDSAQQTTGVNPEQEDEE